MCASPFGFLRGSAQVMYRDIRDGLLPLEIDPPSVTRIVGDAHFGNFGFMTEDGAHAGAEHVHFCPNDYDDAGVGPADFDLVRFCVSVHVAADYVLGLLDHRYEGAVKDPAKAEVKGSAGDIADRASKAFLVAYADTLDQLCRGTRGWNRTLADFPKDHFLAKYEKKARKRAIGGTDFRRKSELAKRVDLQAPAPQLRYSDRLQRPQGDKAAELIHAFRPFVDDEIQDVALKVGAGTGSANVQRYTLLVGPTAAWPDRLELFHVVEVKQQREAAYLRAFPDLSPINRLNSAHLTVDSQRLMQHRPDRILDEAVYDGCHWLVRTRHNAKVDVDPEDLLEGKVRRNMRQHAEACGMALALAHGRADKRSTDFERRLLARVEDGLIGQLRDRAAAYAEQVKRDHHWLCGVIEGAAPAT